MSDALRAAAAALGAPEAIVRRSAEARAKATGTSVDQVLAAWAGGESPPPEVVPAAAAPAASASPPPKPEQPPEAVGTVATPPATRTPTIPVASTDDLPPPVLMGNKERLGGLVAGVIGLLFLSLLLGVVMPGISQPGNGVRSSAIAFSPAAGEGREVYLEQGCASCHTQMVRNVVSDFGLGPVTLSDTNQVIGYRRYGPDLAAVGTRIADSAVLINLLSGADGHPAVSALGDEELANLTAYLLEAR